MKRIALISDTHSTLDDKLKAHLKEADEIWHAGDVGQFSVLEDLEKIAPTRAVWGNIDDHKVRAAIPEIQLFSLEGVKVAMMHIAGYPGKYNARAKKLILSEKPDIFICGHSHILKVIYDKDLNHLHINPGAAGKSGFHRIRTAIRFSLQAGEIKNMEVVEMKR